MSLAEPASPAPGARRLAAAVDEGRLPQLEDLPDVSGKRVLVRCDFNITVRRGRVVNDQRIRAATPTLQWLVRRGASVTVCTHLGRPGGRVDPRLSLDPVRDVLQQLVPEVDLLENLRFSPGEEANDGAFVDALVRDQDLFVNDAFASAHRPHASVVGPPTRLPSAAGRLLSREVEVLSALRNRPRRPFVAVLGGAAGPEALDTIRALVRFADTVILGGPVAFSAVDALALLAGDRGTRDVSRFSTAEERQAWADLMGTGRLVVPLDMVTASEDQAAEVRTLTSVPVGSRPVDIGHRSAARFAQTLARAGTIFWDGPMGQPGGDHLDAGTRAVAEAVSSASAFTVVSGSETVQIVERLGLSAFVDHVSTGGAASMELLRDGDLPGIRALREAPTRPQQGG